jgi:phage tail sheath gpL-like
MVTAIFAAIQAVIDMPMIAVDGTTVVDVTSKWKGASANGINIEIIGPTDVGVSFAITQPAGGLVNPDVDPALALIGDVWETLVLNCMDVTDTGTLTKYTTFGEGRWGALTRKPLVVFSGETRADQATAIIIPSARKTDRINAQIVAPGSSDIPFVVAARALARIAVRANADPAFDFGGLPLTGISPGTDGEQWDYNERDGAVKVGSSTAEVRDGVVVMADTVTFYHPDGEEPPAYRYVVDIMKLMNILFTLDLIFVKPEWDGAPLIPDDDPTVNPNAKRPKDAVAAIASALDGLGLNAIISDPPTAKASIVAGINVSNPKRLDIELTVQLSGNTNIISIDNNFGFFFGTPAIL